MAREKLVVIGGVAAGMSAASRARRRNPELDIVVLEKGQHVSYGACGLPFYLSGEVADWKDLVVYTPEFFREKRNIDVRLAHEAVEIEPGRKTVHALRPGSQPVAISYDKLVIAAGGAPAVNIPGADLPRVFTCNDLAGTIRLREFLEQKKPKRTVIVGSGYIGLEVADAFSRRGIEVTILGRSECVLDGCESEIGERVEAVLNAHGVRLEKKCAVTSITAAAGGDGLHVHHFGGSEAADVVLLATGIAPRANLAESAGIVIGATGAIAVDERMQTSVNSIYAAGDCVEVRHLVTGKPVYFPLGTTANKQGRVAGENAAGGNARFAGIVGTLATNVFELEVARTGLSIQEARANGFDPDSVTIHSLSHAKYLGGRPLTATFIWDRASERLLGFQVASEDGAAKRIDAAAVALHARMRVPDMVHLDLSYAPPFATVWETLLIAAGEAMKKMRHI
ncbi:MAG: FAD-dependent oxidoreductase [Candidatus Acidiferrales bacterium]